MPLEINKRVTKRVYVKVLQLHWHGPIEIPNSAAASLPCSACGAKLGARRFATAWISDGSQERSRSMRLCETCGLEAEKP